MQGPLETSSCPASIPWQGSSSLRMSQKVPFLDSNPLIQYSGPEKIAWVRIYGESSWLFWIVAWPSINAVTPEFIEVCSLDVGLLRDLANGTLGINGFGVFSQVLGYIIIRVQVEGVWGYNEDQVALVPDSTIFGSQVLLTLGTLTINWIINMIKESEIGEFWASLNG